MIGNGGGSRTCVTVRGEREWGGDRWGGGGGQREGKKNGSGEGERARGGERER